MKNYGTNALRLNYKENRSAIFNHNYSSCIINCSFKILASKSYTNSNVVDICKSKKCFGIVDY